VLGFATLDKAMLSQRLLRFSQRRDSLLLEIDREKMDKKIKELEEEEEEYE
jgi:hypothetical protein